MKRKLPALLEERRKKYEIPDRCFDQVALFDRVLLYQIPINDELGDKAAVKSTIIAPDSVRDKRLTSAPRGVVITAGLAALDYLWANGVSIGSIVKFVRLSPWHMPVGHDASQKEVYLQVVRVGDIVALEEHHRVVLDKAKALHQLRIEGELRTRAEPQPYDDY